MTQDFKTETTMKAKTISMKKVRRAISVAYGVNENEALELMPMFINLKIAA